MGKVVAFLFSMIFFIFSTNLYGASGDLIWQNHYNREGNLNDAVLAVYARAGRVFAAGYTTTDARGRAFTVRAYNPSENGAVLWTSNHNWASADLNDVANDVVVSNERVFAVGYTTTDARGRAFTVRAYDPATGALLWNRRYNREANNLNDEANAVDVTADGEKVFVAGYTTTLDDSTEFAVRAYNAADGATLWSDYFNREGALADVAWDVVAEGGRVFVAGQTQTFDGGSAFTVRAYDESDGTLLWEEYYDREDDLPDDALAVSVRGDSVYVAGSSMAVGHGMDFAVRAYDAVDGSLQWASNFDYGGLSDGARDVVVSSTGNEVIAVGWSTSASLGKAFTVRAYNASSGARIWSNYRHGSTSNLNDEAYAVFADTGKVDVAGYTSTAARGSAFTVRSYNSATGALLWSNSFNRENNTMFDEARAVTLSGTTVCAAGFTSTAAGNLAFSVIAYQE